MYDLYRLANLLLNYEDDYIKIRIDAIDEVSKSIYLDVNLRYFPQVEMRIVPDISITRNRDVDVAFRETIERIRLLGIYPK